MNIICFIRIPSINQIINMIYDITGIPDGGQALIKIQFNYLH